MIKKDILYTVIVFLVLIEIACSAKVTILVWTKRTCKYNHTLKYLLS